MNKYSHPFWVRVDRSRGPSACWPWTGPIHRHNGTGIAHLVVDGAIIQGAHRIAWVLTRGLPRGRVYHTCDNHACCNPRHLKCGTYTDVGRAASGRGTTPHGEKNHSAKLTIADVEAIRASALHPDALAAKYGVSSRQIYRIRKRERWAND